MNSPINKANDASSAFCILRFAMVALAVVAVLAWAVVVDVVS